MNVILDGIKYSEEDKIQFTLDNYEYEGKIKFGIYNDNEGYVDFEHLGFYVEFKHNLHVEGLPLSTITLPDIIREYNGKLIKG